MTPFWFAMKGAEPGDPTQVKHEKSPENPVPIRV
jgi:hypothetical protein